MNRGTWQVTVHGITKSRTRLKRLCTTAMPTLTRNATHSTWNTLGRSTSSCISRPTRVLKSPLFSTGPPTPHNPGEMPPLPWSAPWLLQWGNSPSLNSCTNVTSPPRHSFALSNPHPLLPLSSCSLSKALRSQPLSPHLVDAQGTWPENTGRWKPMAAEAPTLKTCPCWLLSTCSQVTNPPAEHGLTRRVTSHSAWTWWAKSGVKPKKLLLASRYKASHKGDHKTTATVYMPGPALDPRNMPSKTPKPCNNLRGQLWWVPF